jgi:Spy/CpxP family protein refolding chaperone
VERGSRTKLLAALVLVAVFGSGLLLGYAADSSLVSDSEVASAEKPSPEPMSGEQRPRRPLVYEQLNPTLEQNAVIDSILVVHRARMNKLDQEYREARHAYRMSYDEVIQDTRDAIAAVFPPEQATEYRRLLAEFDRRREAERAGEESRN